MDIYNQGVLVVDDEDSVQLLIEAELDSAGFKKIYKAMSGIQCIDKLKEYGDKIVIILMDINMPGMDGMSTVQHIMNHHDGVVGVIFYTGYQEFKDKSRQLGNEHVLNLDYIIKSSSMSELISSIENNIKLVLDKRKKILANGETNLLKEVLCLKEDIKALDCLISEINKKIYPFWVDVGKQILITIILAAFVISFLSSGLSGIIKDFINNK